MRWHIMYAHESHCTPDLVIKCEGKAQATRPSMVPLSIALEAPGLRPDAKQLYALNRLIGDSEDVEFSPDARGLEQIIEVIRMVTDDLLRSGDTDPPV